jgi:hypothetical protein
VLAERRGAVVNDKGKNPRFYEYVVHTLGPTDFVIKTDCDTFVRVDGAAVLAWLANDGMLPVIITHV